ncbi:MAG: sensor histidine kinase [Saprospiraceae bacterium]|nr:sensor histidine kinase [Saprospiraceae bacterium]
MKNKATIIGHLIFWLFYLTVVGTGGTLLGDRAQGWAFVWNSIVFGGLVIYGNLFFILPYLLEKKYGRFAMLGLGFVTVLIFLRFQTNHLFGLYLCERYGWPAYFFMSVQILALFLLSTMFGGFMQWFRDRERTVFLQKEKLEGELKFLKTQVNPHFLFNTLNNIYSLAYRQHPNTAPMIATLSKIMRYHLYDGSRERVSLLKEAELLQDFVALQRLRHGDGLDVDFYAEGMENQHEIAPLLLINFIENSFKHSDVDTNPDAFIRISLTVEEGQLNFSVENSFRQSLNSNVGEVQNLPDVNSGEGVGLKNAQRLLDLAYPGRYELAQKAKEGVYGVRLRLRL